MHEATFARSGGLSGVALHCGGTSRVAVHPSPSDHGVTFRCGGVAVAADIANLGDMAGNTTTLTGPGIEIRTVEHVLSALYGLGVTNCLIEIEGARELPFLDGSARPWVELFLSMGVTAQPARRKLFEITEMLAFSHQHSHYQFYPSSHFTIECTISVKHTIIGQQAYRYEHSASNYVSDISLARSFLREPVSGSRADLEPIRQRLKGLSFGRDRDAMLILYTATRYLTELRCEREPVRHKILDFIGDLSLLGRELRGHFVLSKPSHRGNVMLAHHLRAHAPQRVGIDRTAGDEPRSPAHAEGEYPPAAG